ncbi:alpha/beta fold hydrolase [Peribacillus saganii]|uniref:alpha/beta fold hydrolase n=1 Tax=Peribacillus saganii TaxID=2303992 RepID=UPI0013146943|nr:alpha/beta hydrolase [Peribacillus saganii]
MLQGWVKNGDIRIHYLDNTGTSEKDTPLVIIPGLTEADDDYEEMIRELLPRRTVVITLRGRGQSEAPSEGHTLADHVSDVESVINNIVIDSFILFGYSRGVSYALGYAIRNRERIRGSLLEIIQRSMLIFGQAGLIFLQDYLSREVILSWNV